MDNARKIAEYVTAHEVGAISSLPVDNFVSRKQACDVLGWTVQEFRKNQRVKNGFIIFYATLQGERYYLRESVEMFRDTKDGRFNILTCGQRVTRLQVLAATIQ
jgi:hypothetical protein